MIEREVFKEGNGVKKPDGSVFRGGRREEACMGDAGMGDDEAFGVLNVTIVPILIKMVMEGDVRTLDAIKEVIVISVVIVIEYGGVPRRRTGHDLLW
jgi:hypothetical protein